MQVKLENTLLRTVAVILFFIILNFTCLPKLYAENVEEVKPVPYTEDEFPFWAKELRRFEILSFGALPIVTMLSFWTYDIARSIKHAGDKRYYPWPMKKAEISVPLSSTTQRNIFLTAVGISMGIALTDICVRAIIRSVREKRVAQENILYDESIQLEPLE